MSATLTQTLLFSKYRPLLVAFAAVLVAFALLVTRQETALADTCWQHGNYFTNNTSTGYTYPYECDGDHRPIYRDSGTNVGCIPPLICGYVYDPYAAYGYRPYLFTQPFFYQQPVFYNPPFAYATQTLCYSAGGVTYYC